MNTELIKSCFALDGQTLLLDWNSQLLRYEVGTRFMYLYKTRNFGDAQLVLSALTFAESASKIFVGYVLKEMRRLPYVDSRFAGTYAQWEWMIIQNALLREKGLRPIVKGSKKSVIEWVPTKQTVPVTLNYQRTDKSHVQSGG